MYIFEQNYVKKWKDLESPLPHRFGIQDLPNPVYF